VKTKKSERPPVSTKLETSFILADDVSRFNHTLFPMLFVRGGGGQHGIHGTARA